MNLFKSIKKVVIGALTALTSVLPSAALADNTPRFNQLDGDLELLTGRNITAGQSSYSDPVTATDNDTVRVRVFYHNNALTDNGQNGEAARNTKISVTLPTTDATSHVLSARLSADNAGAVAGTFVNGQEVGQPGLTINTDNVTSLNMVSGSVKWYPNGSNTPTVLPNGQSGDAIITAEGINIGDITGCWQYSGFVTFDVIVNPAGNPDIVRSKRAYNVTQGVDATLVKANAADTIVYTLITENRGQRVSTAYVVEDDISDILEYANFISASDSGSLKGGTVSYPAVDIKPGEIAIRTFDVQVKPESEWSANGNFVMTNVYGNRIDIPIEPPTGRPALTIEKQVKNVTQSFDWRDEVNTKRNDVVEYRIRVKNVSAEYAHNVNIKDLLQSGINFEVGSVQLERDGVRVAINDNIISGNGYTLSSALKPGEEITIYFQAKVGSGNNDGDRLRNIATATADETDSVDADAFIKVEVPAEEKEEVVTTPVEPTPILPITGPADIAFALFALGTSGATTLRYAKAKKALARAASGISVL